jgi:hypothetical protein
MTTFRTTALGCLLAAALAVGTVACGPGGNDQSQGGAETQGAGRGMGGPGMGGPAGAPNQTATTVPPPR